MISLGSQRAGQSRAQRIHHLSLQRSAFGSERQSQRGEFGERIQRGLAQHMFPQMVQVGLRRWRGSERLEKLHYRLEAGVLGSLAGGG